MAIHSIDDITGADIIRFWSKVSILGQNDCWEWVGFRNQGYGRMLIGRSSIPATHISLIASGFERKLRQFALHACDNPPCCNPAHLRWGSPADNVRDRDERRRHKPCAGQKHGMSKLTEAQAIEIMASRERTIVLAARYNVNRDTITNIKSGRTWGHLKRA